ncbi:MAG: putative chromate transport protein [Lentisphaerae bacterium ADurb.Bin242]|nr:MAG: putative chromate transport protein [Lentisphaerae bacterium ADurb.Bin242]
MGQETMEAAYWKKLWILFFTFARIAALVVGGGLAILPVVEETFSRRNKWLTQEELLEMTALAQTIPGIIACNAAVYVGMKIAGIGGMIAAALGVCFPSVTIILVIAAFFPHLEPSNPYVLGAFAGVRACITGLILVTAYRFAKKTLTGRFEVIAAILALLLLLMKINPVYVILGAMPLGVVYAFWHKARGDAPLGEEDPK